MKKLIILLIITFNSTFIAQELNARVTVNYEHLDTPLKEKLETFGKRC